MRKKRGKGQVSLEYMIIIGFVVLSLIPLALVYFTYASDTKDQIIDSQVNQIAKKIVDSAESVYYLGELSRTTLRLYMPENIVNVSIGNNELNFKVRSIEGVSDVTAYSSVNITGDIDVGSGIKLITVESRGDFVSISSE